MLVWNVLCIIYLYENAISTSGFTVFYFDICLLFRIVDHLPVMHRNLWFTMCTEASRQRKILLRILGLFRQNRVLFQNINRRESTGHLEKTEASLDGQKVSYKRESRSLKNWCTTTNFRRVWLSKYQNRVQQPTLQMRLQRIVRTLVSLPSTCLLAVKR